MPAFCKIIKTKKLGIAVVALLLIWWFSFPSQLFNLPISTVIEDKNGDLLGAQIAQDGQWRFPSLDTVPEKMAQCVITFEDKRFRSHIGVSVLALARAMRQNIKAGRIVSGASTLSMQTIRLARGNPPRTLWQKLIEILMALRLDASYSKDEILALWMTYAPFGGNVVGLEAASWRYYGKGPELLSWSEAATLAVLPNSPALIHPGRNRSALEKKRNALLAQLKKASILNEEDYQLACLEPLPLQPKALPRLAPHLLDRVKKEKGEGRWQLSLDARLQENINHLANIHQKNLATNAIQNIAILVCETNSGKVLAYVGNPSNTPSQYGANVDLVKAARSPGSLLKPILYALAVESGTILPQQLLADVPTSFNGFKPSNFHKDYTGAITAQQALSRSLNIPFAVLLQQYSVPLFHDALQKFHFSYINKEPDHYGLSLVLGGCEINLWQAVGWYSSMGRLLNKHYEYQGAYDQNNWQLPTYLAQAKAAELILQSEPTHISAGSAWHTLEALKALERPDTEGHWELFENKQSIAWKTGTSFGFRDAWAVGVTPQYTIGVWVGNADGEGRTGLVGVKAAAPVLFDVLGSLPNQGNTWFEAPLNDLTALSICKQSGLLASPICPKDTIPLSATAQRGAMCSYHRLVHLDGSGHYQVNQSCVDDSGIHPSVYFELPPLQAYFYKPLHPDYKDVPPWSPACVDKNKEQLMQWIYPRHSGSISIPKDWDGQKMSTVFSIAHQRAQKKVFWHLDGQFIGTTQGQHEMSFQADVGKHYMLAVDEDGRRLWRSFEIK